MGERWVAWGGFGARGGYLREDVEGAGGGGHIGGRFDAGRDRW